MTKKITALYAIEWEESERGWGIRPDGFSFHRSADEAKKFVEEYNKSLPAQVPDEYSRPSNGGANLSKLLEVSEDLYEYVMENGSIWLSQNNKESYKNYDTTHLKAKPKKIK